MKLPHSSPDPLLQSLAEEAADLPVRAAIEARQRNAQRRQNHQRATLAAIVLIFGVISWLGFPIHKVGHSHSVGSSAPANSVPQPQPMPSGLDPEQMALVKTAGDLPLVLVRDDSGKVTRILLVER